MAPPRLLDLLVVFLATGIHAYNADRNTVYPPQCQASSANGNGSVRYPNTLTATANGTVAILPMALRDIEARFNLPVLTRAIHDLLPDFPADQYPAIVNIQELSWFQGKFWGLVDVNIDGSALRFEDGKLISIEFPFLDHLHDGHTSFRKKSALLVSPSQRWTLLGPWNDDLRILETDFDPSCGAYADIDGAFHVDAPAQPLFRFPPPGSPMVRSMFESVFRESLPSEAVPIGFRPFADDLLRFVTNVTNQPEFGPTGECDISKHLYTTPLSAMGPGGLRIMRGNVSAGAQMVCEDKEPECALGGGGLFDGIACVAGNKYDDKTPDCKGLRGWEDVYGLQGAHLFVEYAPVPCKELQGYPETGIWGDSDAEGTDNSDAD
ncbi:hypothetical protein P152DRAFT_478339 [Eremomyces bilateralis CBS 781.70]|uniref:Uncharacterized protein n=1 Tax=Eremomyces bilateralis CBS 781.70 TaxID=1392243 RepID=A0A6G1GH74_9PEZI|nr:uncharacterized protein P152DRAFT_478339 [Eremomyces bilateralis CBS 781.70]KAF1817342.1 hypothetical protein P152DRAFT_478339 [Eremomyces bilateralis CBS 781.70]